jgi:hypothetical protein
VGVQTAHVGVRTELNPAAYSSDPHSGGPCIMYGGTPYEHLMAPVTEMRH